MPREYYEVLGSGGGLRFCGHDSRGRGSRFLGNKLLEYSLVPTGVQLDEATRAAPKRYRITVSTRGDFLIMRVLFEIFHFK